MLMDRMSERTKKNLSAYIGMLFEHIIDLSQEEEVRLVS